LRFKAFEVARPQRLEEMNCEKYQELLSDMVDGFASSADRSSIEAHLAGCVACAEIRDDFVAIVAFCQDHRGEYEAVPNERALWLRISNTLEAEGTVAQQKVDVPSGTGWWLRLMNSSWQLSFPKLAAAVVMIAVMASLATMFIGKLSPQNGSGLATAGLGLAPSASVPLEDRYRQQQQAIAYWNQRVELNKARWNQQMRETFDRNMSVIDAAVNDSMTHLRQNPHDPVSEDILNDALNDKVALLKEFSEL
jgi:Putative zinc-finger